MSPPWVDSLETGDRIKELSVRFGVTAGQDMNRRCCTFVRENVDFRGQPSEMLISGPRRSRRDRCWPVSAPWRPQGSCSCPDLRALRSGRRRRGCGRGGGGGGGGGRGVGEGEAGRRGGRREGKWKQVKAGGERSPGTAGAPSPAWVCPSSAEDAPSAPCSWARAKAGLGPPATWAGFALRSASWCSRDSQALSPR